MKQRHHAVFTSPCFQIRSSFVTNELVREALRVPKPRRATRPTKAAVERRIAAKRQRSARKRDRSDPPDD